LRIAITVEVFGDYFFDGTPKKPYTHSFTTIPNNPTTRELGGE
jgi:hypothetical protein